MICIHCGTEIDDKSTVCPYCGSILSDESEAEYDGGECEDNEYEEEEGAKKGFSLPRFSKPSVPKLPISTVLAAAAAVFSFLALLMVCFFNGNIKDRISALETSVVQVQLSLSEVESRLSTLDRTVANVQQEAYTQLANTTITITKDITSLTGPVTQGKFNQMFIVKAKGNLDLSKSFIWQKLNSVTGNWEDIEFSGSATSNEQYGLRIENLMDGGEYKSVLWANGITTEAEGSYRCVIEDVNGIKKTSLEATVTIG